jgi:hypothetical protein
MTMSRAPKPAKHWTQKGRGAEALRMHRAAAHAQAAGGSKLQQKKQQQQQQRAAFTTLVSGKAPSSSGGVVPAERPVAVAGVKARSAASASRTTSTSLHPRRHVLVCAPSNGAVNELLGRLCR